MTTKAQKTLTMPVTNVYNSPGPDCDGWLNDSDFQWTWQNTSGTQIGCEYDNGCNCTHNYDPDDNLYYGIYYSANCWPSGSYGVRFNAKENDQTDNCGMNSSYTRLDYIAYPSSGTSAGNYAAATNRQVAGASDCGTTVTYRYSSQWSISGSFNGNNLNGSGFVTNTSCSNAIDIDGGFEATGTRFTNHVTQCTNTWYKYDVTNSLASITFNPTNNSCGVTVYYSLGGTCSTLCTIASGTGTATVLDPGVGTYYIRLSSANYTTNMSVSKVYGATNNFICHATNMGTLNFGGSLSLNSENNFGSNAESGEPNINTADSDNETDWYTFTTGSSVAAQTRVFVQENGDNIDADYHLYKLNDNSYNFPCPCGGSPNWGKLTSIGDGDGGDNVACVGSLDSDGYWCLEPNTTYYIQVRGYLNGGLCADQDQGNFAVSVSSGVYEAGPDDLCDATTMGIINGTTGSLSLNNQSNECASTQSGEFGGGQNTVWYYFQTGSTVGYDFNINMDAETNGLNSDIYVYEICGNACSGSTALWSNLTEIDNFFDVNPLPGEFDAGGTISGRIKPNSTYYVRADGTSTVGTTGGFDIDMSFSGGAYASNDLICNAQNISTVSPGNNSITNGTIDRSSSEDHCSLDEPNQADDETTVWYKYSTGTNVGSFLSFDVDFGFGCTPDLRIYTGPSTLSGCPFSNTSNGFSQLTYIASGGLDGFYEIDCVDPNTTYYLQVDEDGLCSGSFTLEVISGPAPPSNDLPCNAVNVTTQPENTYSTTNISGTNINATNCNEPNPGWTLDGNDAGVWYAFQPAGRNIIIDANSNGSDNIDIQLAIYEGPCGNSAVMTPNYVDRDWDAGLWDEDFTLNCLDPTQTYYLVVDGSAVSTLLGNGVEGNFDLSFYFPYEGGRTTCTTGAYPARDIGTVPNGGTISYVNTSNFCGLSAAELPTSGGTGVVPAPPFTVNKAVWYKFRPPASGSVKINANSDPVIGPALGVGSGDEINLEMAVYESLDGSCSPASWTILDYASYSNGTLSYNEELIVNCMDPSKDYWLLVDGEFDATLLAGGTEGYFEIIMEDYGITTTNDLACDAIPFTSNPTTLSNWNTCNTNMTVTLSGLNNYCANNLNEPSPSNWTPLPATAQPVWFSFVAPPSGKLEIRLNTTTSLPWRQDYLNGKLAVYDLPDGENICTYIFTAADEVESDYDLDVPPVSTGEDMEVECLVPGRTYYLMVDGKETALYPEWYRGEFSLEFEADPRDAPAPNDSICEAKPLGDPTGGSVGTDVDDLTLLNSPPRHPSDPSYCMRAENSFCATDIDNPPLNGFTLWGYDNTVWYTFIGPTTGAVRVEVDGDVGVDGDEFAPQVVVYESSDGTCNGTFFDLEASPTISTGFGTNVSLDVNCLNTGQTYFIAVDGGPLVAELGDINGYFEVEVTEITPTEFPPSHNDICDAKIIDPFSAVVSISNDTNRCANREFTIPEPSTFTRDHTVWYRFTTPSAGSAYAVSIDVNSQLGWPFGDAVDPQIAVYESSDNTCTGTMTEHFSDYSALGLPLSESADVHCLQPNTTYWIMVDGSALNEQGYFDITVESITPNPIPVNNTICDLVNLGTLGAAPSSTLGGTSTNYYNFCSDTEIGEPVPNAFGIDQTVWFSFETPTLASSDGVNVDVIGLNDPNSLGDAIDLQLALYISDNNSCTGNLTEIESGDNLISFNQSLDDLCLTQNTRYFLQVDGSALNVEGYFTIEIVNDGVTARPVNDDFCDAQALTIGTIQSSDNYCASIESGEPNAGLDVQKSVWFSFVAPPSGRVEIRTIDTDGALSGIDPEWHLYDFDGACAGGLFTGSFTELDAAYFPTIGVANPDDVSDYECLVPGETYYIQVDGTTVGGPEGTFDILISDLEPDYGTQVGPPNATDPEPENNSCDNAISISVQAESCQYSTGTWDQENYFKPTRSVDEISCGSNCGEIWYQFTVPATGFVKIEGNDDLGLLGVNNSELVIAAYRGTCGSLTLIECDNGGFNKDVDYSIAGTPGETIYLQVFDDGGDAINEDFEICVSERCAADDCEDALTAPDILNEGPQCFDVSDATGEDIAGGDAGYGVGGVYTDNPGNSVYFAFETDAFCAGYVLNITTTDIGNVGGLGGAELIVSIYEDDGSLCDHNPLSEPLLDIQTFDNSTYPSGINYTILYEVGSAPNTIKPNTRYVIQIEGNSTTVDGTISVDKICEGREWAYPTAPSTSSNAYCYDGTWRHYYNDAGTPADASDDILIFSVYPNGNVFDGVATIYVDGAPGFAENPGVEASWSMRRHWDFDITSGSIINPVDVKFYYQDSEKQEIITLAQNYAATHSLTYEPFEWFKSADGVSFNPNIHVTPPIVIAGYGSGSGPTITGAVTIQSTAVGVTVDCTDHDADVNNEFCNGVQYVEYRGLTGFSGGTGAAGAGPGGSPLPIELIEFSGENKGDYNEIYWSTATEINNDYFELLHSTNGTDFEVIAQIQGAGNSTSLLNYHHKHYEFINGVNYYRLKNVDYDGSYQLSSIIGIDNDKGAYKESMIIQLYPNPTNFKYVNMDVLIANAGDYQIQVYDLVGKLIYSETVKLDDGLQTLKVNFDEIGQGTYLLELLDISTNERIKKKFVSY